MCVVLLLVVCFLCCRRFQTSWDDGYADWGIVAGRDLFHTAGKYRQVQQSVIGNTITSGNTHTTRRHKKGCTEEHRIVRCCSPLIFSSFTVDLFFLFSFSLLSVLVLDRCCPFCRSSWYHSQRLWFSSRMSFSQDRSVWHASARTLRNSWSDLINHQPVGNVAHHHGHTHTQHTHATTRGTRDTDSNQLHHAAIFICISPPHLTHSLYQSCVVCGISSYFSVSGRSARSRRHRQEGINNKQTKIRGNAW